MLGFGHCSSGRLCKCLLRCREQDRSAGRSDAGNCRDRFIPVCLVLRVELATEDLRVDFGPSATHASAGCASSVASS